MNSIKGIILDKDGTLFRYGEVWGPVLSKAIEKGLSKAKLPDEKREECLADFYRVVGVDKDGNTYPDGIIFRHDRLLRATARILHITIRYRMNPWRVWKAVKGILNHEDFGIRERLDSLDFPGVRETIRTLHDSGYILGIVTTDTEESTSLFLSRMGIAEYISFIRTKNKKTHQKPNPEAIKEFCREYGFSSNEVAVVGDTIVDMEFAHQGKAGYAIAVLTGSGDNEKLSEIADVVYPALENILDDPILFP